MKQPLVSALLSVYNGADTITRALDSIATQRYRNVEIICVEDGSNDDTQAILSNWKRNHPETQMTILRNKQNIGLAASLNRGITAAHGTYIARIDADDQWLPEKIEKQVSFLLTHSDYGMVGSFYVNERGEHRRLIRLPVNDSDIKRSMFRKNPFGHSCVVIRKELLTEVGGYNGQLREDRDLWFRLLPRTNFYNLPEFLVVRNISTSYFTSSKELRRNIRTVHTYIRQYRAPLVTYVWLVEPVLVYLYHSIRKYVIR